MGLILEIWTLLANEQVSEMRRLTHFATHCHCQKIKTVVQFGIDNGVIKTNPFSGIHLRKGEKSVQFLTEEVSKIRTTDSHNESLNRVRDVPTGIRSKSSKPERLFYTQSTLLKAGVITSIRTTRRPCGNNKAAFQCNL